LRNSQGAGEDKLPQDSTVCPDVSTYVPGGHGAQPFADATPLAVPYVPAAQAVQDEDPLSVKRPMAQAVQDEEPFSAKRPMAQVMHTDAFVAAAMDE
jgi:hypothetical protein